MLKAYRYIAAVLVLFLPVTGWADGSLHVVKKNITKSYNVKTGTLLSINNQYGNVSLKGWKQKNLLIKITVSGQATKLAQANSMLGLVNIKSRQKPGEITLRTVIDTASLYLRLSPDDQCHISYQVFVPDGLKLNIKNSFGNILAESITGELSIDEKFGDLKVERTSGSLNFSVEQGNADIDRLRNGFLKFKGFTRVRIGELSGTVDAKFWSGGKVDLGLSGDLQKLDIDAADIKPLNITNFKQANADLKIHSKVSKIVYNGHMMITLEKPLSLSLKKPAKTDSAIFITGKGDSTKKPGLKLLDLKKISVTAMKNQDYGLKSGSATIPITIKASFCVVEIKD
ncbi:MAG: hypothetical protein ACXVJB_09025 [Mucilaginibacter sp.]